MDQALYNELNKAWKSTCRILLGEEIGELREYEPWLKGYLPQIKLRKSHLSGKEVTLAMDDYCRDANFISGDEIRGQGAGAPLGIDEIKDIDSIMNAVSERWEYCGNRVLGNSTNVELSDLVIDSNYVSDSVTVKQASHIYSAFLIGSGTKYFFGGGYFDASEFDVRCMFGLAANRCFESHLVANGGDLYFCYNAIGCHDMLFSFNQRNKRNIIGNVELPKDRYLELKKKLLGEIKDELKKSKELPSLFGLVPDTKPDIGDVSVVPELKEETVVSVEKAFAATFKVLLKTDCPHNMDELEGWLSGHIIKIKEVTSAFGIQTTMPMRPEILPHSALLPVRRVVSEKEALELGKLKLPESDISDFGRIMESLPKIGYFTAEAVVGSCRNLIKAPAVADSSNLYKEYDAVRSEYAGISSNVFNSKYIFGSHRMYDSQFCMKCYNSLNLNRCFEVDTSTKCRDAYFCHNCEGLADAMFCWNVKGKRHAIGNISLPQDQYEKTKNTILEQIADKIARNKNLEYDIFNIGCVKKK